MTRLPKGKARRLMTQGVKAHRTGELADAVDRYRKVLDADPTHPHALYFAAVSAYELGDTQRAIRLTLASLASDDTHADSYANLGKFYRETSDLTRSHMAYLAALEHDPNHIEALIGAGDHFWEQGDEEAARLCWARSEHAPVRTPEVVYNRSLLRVRLGHRQGWADYEHRWNCPPFWRQYARPDLANVPLWTGEQSLDGQRLYLHGEQGQGDVLQMLRYVPWLTAAGARVVLEVYPSLTRLAEASFPGVAVVPRGTPYRGPVDLQCPMMSLPARFGGEFPREWPYLRAPQHDALPEGYAEAWRNGVRRVGIVWAGSKGHANDAARSIPVETLAPLWDVSRVLWTSLQIGDRAHETPKGFAQFIPKDFADTARIVAGLDLVISVDTSTAHLAGALGVPTWLLLPRLPDFRWGLEGETTEWYPSVRIWRQERRGDWPGVVDRVAEALRQLLPT